MFSSNFAMLKMNTPFLQHYLNFFEVKNNMYNGTLTTEKRADNDYEIEFCNVWYEWQRQNHNDKTTLPLI